MGYSSRYHAASLAAVFIALAIGILIGVGLADDVVSSASEELEDTLRADLDEARAEVERLQTELDREREFAGAVYPALVADRLEGSSIALIGVGELPQTTAGDVQAAIEPAGGSLDAVAVLAVPPDTAALAAAAGPGFNPARPDEEALRTLGEELGSALIGGERPLRRVRGALFSRFSGDLETVDRVVLTPAPPLDLEPVAQAQTEAFIGGLYTGLQESGAAAVAVERTDAEPGGLGPPATAGLSTVDHVDLTAGKVALVFSLLGSEGDFGIKEGADRFLPELIDPGPPAASPEP